MARAPRLLIVDDDVRTARRLASMLEEDGFVAEVAGGGAEAIARLESGPAPDAIITDVVMGRVGGLAVLGEARRRDRRVPVVFVTGHPELLANTPVPFEGSPIVFTKPVSYAELSARLLDLFSTAAE